MAAIRNSRTFGVLWLGLAFSGGLYAGWIDFNSAEVQFTVLLLVLFGAVFGFAQHATRNPQYV